jgi:hypothetical protein
VGTDLWLSQFRTSLSDYSNTVKRFALLNSRGSMWHVHCAIFSKWVRHPTPKPRLLARSTSRDALCAATHGYPGFSLTPAEHPWLLESEVVDWLKAQPLAGKPIRVKQPPLRKKRIDGEMLDEKRQAF